MVTATFDGKVADTQEGDAGYKDFPYRQLLRVSHLVCEVRHPNRITIGLRRVLSPNRVSVLDPPP